MKLIQVPFSPSKNTYPLFGYLLSVKKSLSHDVDVHSELRLVALRYAMLGLPG